MDQHFTRDADEVIAGLGRLNQRFTGKRVLLTGAGGFLGSHFVHYFLRLNDGGHLTAPCHLTAVENYIRGIPRWLQDIKHRSDLSLQKANITTTREFNHPDFVIHAASIASPTFYRQFPIETMDANVIGLRNLLDYSVTHLPEGFLFFSTSEIYGDPDATHIPTDENYRGNVSCIGPRACYDESKRFGETLCVNFAKVHGVPVTIARPFNNYGPGLRLSDRRVLPDFFRDALAGRDIVLLSDGRATRTFCYTADAIEGYLRVLLRGRPGEPYNIGVEAPEVSMRDLASLVIKTTGTNAGVKYQISDDKEYLTDNPQRRCPNIRKAREELDYQPHVSFEAGLQRACEYYLDHADE